MMSPAFDDINVTQLHYVTLPSTRKNGRRGERRKREKKETCQNGERSDGILHFEPSGCVIIRFFASVISQATVHSAVQSPYSGVPPAAVRQANK